MIHWRIGGVVLLGMGLLAGCAREEKKPDEDAPKPAKAKVE